MTVLCPSATCETGALLIGRAVSPTKVVILPTPIIISTAFVDEASKHRAAEKRFRFASPCKGSGCRNWTGQKCKVPEETLSVLPPLDDRLPDCGIRNDCRWFTQDGALACSVCVQVTTQRDY